MLVIILEEFLGKGECDDARNAEVHAMPSRAVPLVSKERLVGVLAGEGTDRAASAESVEAALKLIGCLTRGVIVVPERDPRDISDTRLPVRVRYYAEDDSVYIDDTYVVKGLAGRVLFVILTGYLEHGRAETTNRELRLDPAIKLPRLNHNLEARLLLLRKRLEDGRARLRVQSVARGRLRLECDGPIKLQVVSART